MLVAPLQGKDLHRSGQLPDIRRLVPEQDTSMSAATWLMSVPI